MSRPHKPTLRDFLLMQAQTRAHLCMDDQIFDPCTELSQLTPFEKATFTSWSTDSSVDRGLNLYILLHYLSAINENSYYYHYVNNGNSDGTNMFGHIIGTSRSGKSSALAPHMDALSRTLTQMDTSQAYVQYSNKNNELSHDQPFIISNATALHVYRSLIYGNRLLCSTECDTLLSNLGVYGNQYNDPRFAENVNMLIQMFDGTKHQNRSTLSTSYTIPEGRRASIIGASVGDPYARVSQQHYKGNGVSGAHNRFTHYPCPIMKAIKMNAGTTGVISNMFPSLQHVYTVSLLLGKVEYVARQNVYDKATKKRSNVFESDVEEKWQRLHPKANRQYFHSSAEVEIEMENLEADATPEESKSAFYYMFRRVYNQWQEATLTEKQEHEAIINFKNSTKIPRFICNFARFRAIMNILWDDAVYASIQISEVVKLPYRVSNDFIEAAKTVIDKLFPRNLHRDDDTRILIIEKDTAIMGDLFFAHVDSVSRRLFDLSEIQEKFNSSPPMVRSSKKVHAIQETGENEELIYADASLILQSKFLFFTTSTFTHYREFHNKKDRLTLAIDLLLKSELIYQASGKNRFIKGCHKSFKMATPYQIKNNKLSIDALAKLGINTADYEQLWKKCLLPLPEMAAKIEKPAIDCISMHLSDYIPIIHRLGNSNDPIAQEILKPGLRDGQIGINFVFHEFSLAPEHMISLKSGDDIMEQLNTLCFRAIDQTDDLLKHDESTMMKKSYPIVSTSTPSPEILQSNAVDMPVPLVVIDEELQHKEEMSNKNIDVLSTDYDQPDTCIQSMLSNYRTEIADLTSNVDEGSINDCVLVLKEIQGFLDNDDYDIICNDGILTANRQNRRSSITINDPYQTQLEATSSHEITNEIIDSVTSVEYDDLIPDDMNMNGVAPGVYCQNQSHEAAISSSSTILESGNVEEINSVHSDSSNIDYASNLHASSPRETMFVQRRNSSQTIQESLDGVRVLPAKTFNINSLSKRRMLKPFIAFTQTDVTRLYNRADTKNSVIAYLRENQFIMQINDLFLSTNPMKNTFKPEIGYVKLFPVSQMATETSAFEAKLREKVGITFDEYFKKVLGVGDSYQSAPVTNNMFNTAHHNWLLNRCWYEKFNTGHQSMYYENKIICPDTNISPKIVSITTVSEDNVHDAFDRPRSKLSASQRTSKELRRLGAQRQRESDDEPPPKRRRIPRRFADDQD